MTIQESYLEKIEQALEEYLPRKDLLQRQVFEAMEYSLMAGGKRIRPILTLEFCRLNGGNTEAALPFACAVEMIHTYSLIHDDLPCMDNDDLRRGKPSNHKVYGEAMALLAGDGLLTLAFETMLSPNALRLAGADKAAAAAGVLARSAGALGMIGGQVIDLDSEGKQIPLSTLRKMDEGKTQALIFAACQMGCILGGADEKRLAAAKSYADSLGLAFQIVDDILDVEGEASVLGKKTGSDSLNEKCTYVSLLGLEKAKQLAQKLTDQAVEALSAFSGDTSYLSGLAQKLAVRKN